MAFLFNFRQSCCSPTTGGAGGLIPISWFQTTNVTVASSGYLLKANGGTNNDYNARVPYSRQISSSLSFDVQFTIGEDDSICGLTPLPNTSLSYSDIQYALLRKPTGFYILEGGSLPLFVTNANRDLTWRIVCNGSSVKYYYNGVLQYTSLVAIGSEEFMLKMSFYLNSTPVGNTIISI